MANFLKCFNFVLANEDFTPPRYEPTPDPTAADPGAQALSGINSAAWPKDFAFIASLPKDQRALAVQSFYYKNYWNTWYVQLTSDEVAKRVLDMAFNTCQKTAVKLLQEAVNDLSISPPYPLSEDGQWGPLTIAQTNLMNEANLVRSFQRNRADHYQKYDAKNKNLAQLIARAEK
jgi:lysozyme family protein